MEVTDLRGAAFRGTIGDYAHDRFLEELALLDGASSPWDKEKFLAGELTPVFFASAITNFGVEPFLQAFVELAPSPRRRATSAGVLEPDASAFNAFIFKIQANMDPRHRDRIAFARICSGTFRREMSVTHCRTGKTLALTKSFQFLAQERIQIEEAFSGDVIGLWDPGILRIGDSLCESTGLEFEGIPRFSPEHFVRVRVADPLKRKQLKKGLEQLSEEGAVQLFYDRRRLERDPVLGAVGVLQFDVTQYRLKAEYGASVTFERLPYLHARWVEGDVELDRLDRPGSSLCVFDVEGRPLVLFMNDWALQRASEDHPKVKFVAAVQPGRSSRAAGS
jgi:peptide chain release factor 3